MQDKPVHLIITGGTIDGYSNSLPGYNEAKGVAPGTSIVKRYLEEKINPCFALKTTILFLKDSSDITDDELESLKNFILKSGDDVFVISHGTDKIVETGQFLKPSCAGKTVILTGAFKPLPDELSDGSFNLGFACHAALTVAPGIYIALNGCLFDPDNAKKNFEEQRMEKLR